MRRAISTNSSLHSCSCYCPTRPAGTNGCRAAAPGQCGSYGPDTALPIIDAVRVVELLRLERQSAQQRFCGQCAQRMDALHAIRQHCVQVVLAAASAGWRAGTDACGLTASRVSVSASSCSFTFRQMQIHRVCRTIMRWSRSVSSFRNSVASFPLELHIVGTFDV